MSITRASSSPVRRVVVGDLVVDLRYTTLTIRPLRSREPILEATYREIVTAVLLRREPRKRSRRNT